MSKTHKVLIVGGGTAGWISAGILAASHPDVEVTVVESANTPPVGVGEGTWPTMRKTLRLMGISEADFLRASAASFKQGSQFIAWRTGDPQESYYHPFSPVADLSKNLPPVYTPKSREAPLSFAQAFCPQLSLCEFNKAPKQATMKEYQGAANYGYHLDASKFSAFLSDWCQKNLGVNHLWADVTQTHLNEEGAIRSLATLQGAELTADLFIDCTGFSARLIGQALGSPFVDKRDELFVDSALALQLPYENDMAEMASVTRSTAQQAGWIWDIGLQQRRGIGYAFSSRHTDLEEAERCLRSYAKNQDLPIKHLQFTPGYRRQPWIKNCVAVGLSAGFVEPLEASSLMLVEISAHYLAERLSFSNKAMAIVAEQFNQEMCRHWNSVVDFIKLHYILSERDSGKESCFWRDNRQEQTISASLRARLLSWQDIAPSQYDVEFRGELFSWLSYQYILYGMGQVPDSFSSMPPSFLVFCEQLNDQTAIRSQQLLSQMPGHYELLQLITR